MRHAVLALLLLATPLRDRDDVATPTALRIADPPSVASNHAKRPSDTEIRKRMIAESIDAYPGSCACPYQRASNGSQCGRRSAYNRGGGYAPLCFESDISDEMVRKYRAELGLD